MSKKISFSSVLRDKNTYEQPTQMGLPTLASLVQEFAYNPQGNYTLNLSSVKPRNLRQNPSRRQLSQIDFEHGANQLDEWINSHSSQSQNNYQNQFNKQNSISNLQYGRKSTTRQSPIKGPHSPRYNSGINTQVERSPRNKMGGNSRTKNLSMNQLSKMYVKNKNNSQVTTNQIESQQEKSEYEPVWKFSSQNQEQDNDYNQNRMNPKRNPYVGKQKYSFNKTPETTQETFRPQQNNIFRQINSQIDDYKSNSRLNEQENQFLQQKYDNLKQQHIQQIYPSPQNTKQTKNQNLEEMIGKIKSSLSEQIETMANKIIEQREKAQLKSIKDEQLLISQRESESERQKMRIKNVQSEINEYLKIKNGNSQNKNQYQTQREELEIKNDFNDANSGVGYSFASQFNSKIASNIRQDQQKENESVPSSNSCLKKSNKMKTSQEKAFCLPNIDEVRSEHDYHESNTEKDKIMGSQSQYGELVQNFNSNNVQIDSKYIKEIQSVAYGYQEPQTINSFKNKQEYEPVVEGRPSLNEKVAKLSMSMSIAQNQINDPSKDQIHKETGQVYTGIEKERQIKIENKLMKQDIAQKLESREINMKKQDNFSEIEASIKRMPQHTKQTNESLKRSPPLTFKQSRPDSKTRQFNIQQSNKSANSNGNKQGSSVSEHKRLLKITLSPKYQQTQQNNVTVTNFAQEAIKPDNGCHDSINQINSSISNHIKLDSYFGTKKVEQQEPANFSISREPMIKNTGNESRRDIKVSMKNSMKNSMGKNIKGSCSEDKFQFDLDF